MSERDTIKFLNVMDSIGILQNIIRSFELSKRLLKENVQMTTLLYRFSKKPLIHCEITDIIKDNLENYKKYFPELKNKYTLAIIEYLFRFSFLIGRIPFLYWKFNNFFKKNKNLKFIYASGPPFYTHMIGYLLKKKFNLPLVIEYRDPWSFNPYIDQNNQNVINKIDIIIEKKILRDADEIITISPALKRFLEDKFPFTKNKRIYDISHGINKSQIKKPAKRNFDKITLTFTGMLYVKRNITPLLIIISKLKKENFFQGFPFQLKIFGGYAGINLETIIKRLNIQELVYVGGIVSRETAINEINVSDLAVHIGENIDYPTIAFKVWDYLSCCKKILYIGLKDSYTAQFLEENNFGFVIPINKLSEGKNSLKELLLGIKAENIKTTFELNKLEGFLWEQKVKDFYLKVVKKFI